MSLPRLIAIQGYPGSGKGEVQKHLQLVHGYEPVDDGKPLREIAKMLFGLTDWHVYTQEGKASYVLINGRHEMVRTVLQDLGRGLEARFGENLLPMVAMRGLDPDRRYSFGSVRMKQGWLYKKGGGVVIEVVRPGVGWDGTETENYDKSATDILIENDGPLCALPERVDAALGCLV